MDKEMIFGKLSEGVVEGDEEMVQEWTDKALEAGMEPLDVINDGLTKGIELVGLYFDQGTYFLPDLLLGAKAMEAGLNILEPLLAGKGREPLGKILMGTVEGDLHEIGKNIVIMMLKTAGFQVTDLGIDVPAQVFIDKCKELQPDVIGISALLTTTVGRQKEIIELLEEEGLRKQVKVIIGGSPINQAWADKIGADGYGEDATIAVAVVKNLLNVAAKH